MNKKCVQNSFLCKKGCRDPLMLVATAVPPGRNICEKKEIIEYWFCKICRQLYEITVQITQLRNYKTDQAGLTQCKEIAKNATMIIDDCDPILHVRLSELKK